MSNYKNVMLLWIVIGIFSASSFADTIARWTGNGKSDGWTDAGNWNINRVPDNTLAEKFHVILESAGNDTVNIATWDTDNNITLNKLEVLSGNFDLEKRFGRFEFYIENGGQGMFNHSELRFSGEGEWNLRGILVNYQNARIEFQEPIELTGTIYNSGDMQITGIPSFSIDGGNFENSGTLLMIGGIFSINDGALMNNTDAHINGTGLFHTDAAFINEGDIATALGDLSFHTNGNFVNKGQIKNTSGTSIHIMAESGDHENYGNIDVCSGGSIHLETHAFINVSGGKIKLKGGSISCRILKQMAGATLVGIGDIHALLDIQDQAVVELIGNSRVFDEVMIHTGGQLSVLDGTCIVTGPAENNGTVKMKGGRLIPRGGWSNYGMIQWQVGDFFSWADYNLDGQTNLADFAEFSQAWMWQSNL